MMRKIILYQFVFITLIPLAVLLIIYGHGLIEMIYGIHLKLYKLLFLFIGFLSIMDLYSKIPKENKSH